MSTANHRRRAAEPVIAISSDTSPIPREQLVELLGRVRRGEVTLDEATGAEHGADDRKTPVVVHHAGLEVWLAAKR